jgi:hypothetical protein
MAMAAQPASSTSLASTEVDESLPDGSAGSSLPATVSPSPSSTAQRSDSCLEEASTRCGPAGAGAGITLP